MADAARLLGQVDVPVLVIIGKKDIQVDWVADGEPLQRAALGHDRVTFLSREREPRPQKRAAAPLGAGGRGGVARLQRSRRSAGSGHHGSNREVAARGGVKPLSPRPWSPTVKAILGRWHAFGSEKPRERMAVADDVLRARVRVSSAADALLSVGEVWVELTRVEVIGLCLKLSVLREYGPFRMRP